MWRQSWRYAVSLWKVVCLWVFILYGWGNYTFKTSVAAAQRCYSSCSFYVLWRYVFHLKITKSLKMHIFKILFQDQFSRYMCFEDIYFPLKIHIPLSIYIFSRSYMSSFEDIYFGRYVVSKEEIHICFEAICFPLKIHIFIWRYITLFWRFKFSFDAIHFHFMIYILLWR